MNRPVATTSDEPTRADDEQVLAILAAKARGQSLGQIARAYGLTRSIIAGIVGRVVEADILHSGEPAADVIAAHGYRAGPRGGRRA